MTGDEAFLTQEASLMAPRELRPLFRRVLSFLLSHQFVYGSELDGVYKVAQGSGMGLKHSASVASAAFLHKVELVKGLARAAVQRKLGIKLYVRYVDNLIFLGKNCDFGRHVVNLLHDCAPYAGKVEEASLAGITCLDVFLWKGPQWG